MNLTFWTVLFDLANAIASITLLLASDDLAKDDFSANDYLAPLLVGVVLLVSFVLS